MSYTFCHNPHSLVSFGYWFRCDTLQSNSPANRQIGNLLFYYLCPTRANVVQSWVSLSICGLPSNPARHGCARLDLSQRGRIPLGLTQPDPTRPDPATPDPTRPDPTRLDPIRLDPFRPFTVRPDSARPDLSRPDLTRSDSARRVPVQ